MDPLAALLKPKRSAAFAAFLTERGCDVLATTNPYEVIRFRANGRTNVLYRNNRGGSSITGPDIEPAAAAFATSSAWSPGIAQKRPDGKRRRRFHQELYARDGDACFFCGGQLGDDVTLEHFVPISHGGPNSLANLALAHGACNKAADAMSVAEKVRLRERMRSEATTPKES